MPSPQALATIFVVAVMGSVNGQDAPTSTFCRPQNKNYRYQFLIDQTYLQRKTNLNSDLDSGYQYVCSDTNLDPKDVCDDLGYACNTGDCSFTTVDVLPVGVDATTFNCGNAAPVNLYCSGCISYDTCGPVLHTDAGKACKFFFNGITLRSVFKQCDGDFRGTPECPACQDPGSVSPTPHMCSGDNDDKLCCQGKIVSSPASSSKKMSGGIVTIAVLAVLS
ncbi:MAG: hypothetical protein CL678_15315, partial [Bdellovibrionaceae bacterium]|nr:hypothetical protein [Pseudobdellovibrionaceae bacterium]